MYTQILATIAALTGLSIAAPTPQDPVELCNPAAILGGPFQLSAFDPVATTSTGLTIAVVSRGVHILVPTADGTTNGASNFTYSSENQRLSVAGVGQSDDPTDGNPLTFGVYGQTDQGGIVQQAGASCFHGSQTPMFVLAGSGGSSQNDWSGWNLCGTAGLTWTGDAAAPQGCTKVGVQIVNASYKDVA